MAKKFGLVGVNGNAYSIMGYTARALKIAGLGDLVPEMQEKAMSGDYNNLIATCDGYVEKANDALGFGDDDEDEEDDDDDNYNDEW